MTKNKLSDLAHRLKDLNRQKDDLETEIELIKNKFKDEMTRKGVDTLSGEDWEVTWKSVTSSRLDQKLFKENHPSLYESFLRTNEYKKFNIK